jgi:Protein of unknown function (DUF2946)
MRHSWFGRLFFALALALQVFSPAAANVAQSNADSAKTAFQICLKTAPDFATGKQQLPGQPERHGGDCAFCRLSCDGPAPFGAAVIEIGVAPVQSRSRARTVADRASPTPREASWRQPRAPPQYS